MKLWSGILVFLLNLRSSYLEVVPLDGMLQPAKRFLQKALRSPDHPRPQVINVDTNPRIPKVIGELKKHGETGPPVPAAAPSGT